MPLISCFEYRLRFTMGISLCVAELFPICLTEISPKLQSSAFKSYKLSNFGLSFRLPTFCLSALAHFDLSSGDAALDAVVAEAAAELEGARVSTDREEVAVVTFTEDEGTSMNAAAGETLVAEIFVAEEEIFAAKEGIFAAEDRSFAVAVVAEVRKLARAVEGFAGLKEEATISPGGATVVEEAEDEASDRLHQKLQTPVFSRLASLHHGQCPLVFLLSS
ncbi:hypothetical protein AAHC03_016897 [Spirometra sp. Aus1]